MFIHEEQQNVAAFCEHATFVDSGFQSFRDQVKHLPPNKIAEAAYFAGAALTYKLMRYFEETGRKRGADAGDYLCSLVMHEIDDYLQAKDLRIEWEPHVPSSWQQ